MDAGHLQTAGDHDTLTQTSDQSPNKPVTNRDERLFELLDRYVSSLHAHDVNTRSGLFRRHPELTELLGYLDSLDSLAPAQVTDFGKALDTESLADFGKYELLAEVGRGGMGVVYRARQQDLDRTVALKMILSSRLASEEDVRRFYAEAKAAGSVRHPNIVGIHEVGQIHGQHYFAMDYIDGQSLEALLRKGPLIAERAAKFLSVVARAVDYLHRHNIVHRDLKPSNILLDWQGHPLVTDFGLAKVFDTGRDQTQTGTIVGTPSYMSPEQAAGQTSEVSAQSDVYSLGAILYELLTGRPPFKRSNALDTLMEVLEGEATLPSELNRHIPRELELICMRCLEKDPQNRYRSAAALADDLEHYLMREPIEARPASLFQQMRRWGRREPALVSRWGGLMVAAAILQANYLISGVELNFHLKIMSVLGAWVVVSHVFQRMLHREQIASVTRFAWAAADAMLLTTILYMADGPLGPLLIGYPLLVAASGLFFRVRLVWFMTCVCLVSYAGLMLLRGKEASPPHYPFIFAATLAVLGVVVAYQVYRMRVLSRFYEHRRLP